MPVTKSTSITQLNQGNGNGNTGLPPGQAGKLPELDPDSESGISLVDNITNVARPTIIGEAPASADVTVYAENISTGIISRLGSAPADKSKAWSIPSEITLADGTYKITAVYDGQGGKETITSPITITIDTEVQTPVAPDLLSAHDSGLSATDNITNIATPTLTGSTEAGAAVALYQDGVLLTTLTADANGAWSYASSLLADGAYRYTAVVTDIAGNTSQASSVLDLVVDTSAKAPGTPDLLPESDSKGDSDSDNITNATIVKLAGAGAEAGARVRVFADGVVISTVTADAAGNWSATVSGPVNDKTVVYTADQTDVAGNSSPLQSPALNVVFDRSKPVPPVSLDLVAGSDSGDSSSDNLTKVTTPTITGKAEANATIRLFDDTKQVGTIMADAAGNWSIDSAVLGDGVHRLIATATDAAGNESARSAELLVNVDTTAPLAPLALDQADSSDSGRSAADDLSNIQSPAIHGHAEAGAHVILYADGSEIGRGDADAAGNWSITSEVALAHGSHQLTATARDAAGNTSPHSQALTVMIDIKQPDAPIALTLAAGADSGVKGDALTNVAMPTISGTAEPDAMVELFADGLSIGSIKADASGNWSITSQQLLADGAHDIHAIATDAAGNLSAASADLHITIDTKAPAAPTAPDLMADSDSNNSTDDVTSVNKPTFSGKAEAGSMVRLYSDGDEIGAIAADANGDWTITSKKMLADGQHILTAKTTDAADNTSDASAGLLVIVDTGAPAAPFALDLQAASDSGASDSDGITQVRAPVISGKVEADADIALYANGVLVGNATADANGDWTVTSDTLQDGDYDLHVTAADRAGNISPSSAVLKITIDNSAAAVSAPDLDPVSDSGDSNADNLTKAAAPVFSGSGAEAGAKIILYANGAEAGVGFADASGNWTVTANNAAAGENIAFTARQLDMAGNLSALSGELNVTIDRTAPVAPAALDLQAASDSGASDSDGITQVRTPVINGKAEAGAHIALYANGALVGNATADANGDWTVTSDTLQDGSYDITVKATDAAHNESDASAVLKITIDNSAAAVSAPDLDSASDSGDSNADNLTKAAAPAFSGSGAEAGAKIILYANGAEAGVGFAAASGNWTVTANNAAAGENIAFTARQLDMAGNLSALSGELNVTIDRTAPAQAILMLQADSGADGSDSLTKNGTVNVSNLEAGASWEYSLDGTTWSQGNGNSLTVNGDGAKTVRVRQTDLAGNTGAASADLHFTLDASAPAVPEASLANDAGSSASDLITSDGTVNVAGLEASGSWKYSTDRGATWQDGSGASIVLANEGDNYIRLQQTDAAGNLSIGNTDFHFVRDTAIPAAPVPTLALDSGSSASDGITMDGKVLVSGLEAGASWEYSTNNGGSWTAGTGNSFTLAGDGSKDVIVRQKDVAGNPGSPSRLSFLIDSLVPAAPVLQLANDTGSSSIDHITGNGTVNVSGLEAGATWQYSTNGGSTWANGSGTSFALSGDGVKSVVVRQTDVAGNSSVPSSAFGFTLDTKASAPSLSLANDTGSSTSDHITSNGTVNVSGLEAGATWQYSTNGGSNWTNGSGTSFALSGDGVKSVVVRQTDVAGNISTVSSSLSVTVDHTAPNAAAPDLDPASDTGSSNTDNNTSDNTPTLIGHTEAGATVGLYEGNTLLGSIAADASGNWAITTAQLVDGTHHLTSKVTDVAGNTSTVSPELVVTIASLPPPVNNSPIAQDDRLSSISEVTVKPNLTSVVISPTTLLANDTDVEDGRPAFNTVVKASDGLTNLSVGGTLTTSGGNLVFTPIKNFYGTAGFDYDVVDSGGLHDQAAVRFNVDVAPTGLRGAEEIEKLYIAVFDRPADPDGLKAAMKDFWMPEEQKPGPVTLDQARDTLRKLGDLFVNFPEYTTFAQWNVGGVMKTWDRMTNDEFIKQVFQNLFGRAPEAAGLKFWADAMDPTKHTPDTVLTKAHAFADILYGAQSADSITVGFKGQAAWYFTHNMDTVGEKDNYKGSDTNQQTLYRGYMDRVKDATSLFNAELHVNETIAQITGQAVQAVNIDNLLSGDYF